MPKKGVLEQGGWALTIKNLLELVLVVCIEVVGMCNPVMGAALIAILLCVSTPPIICGSLCVYLSRRE